MAGHFYRLFTSNHFLHLPCFPNLRRSKERVSRRTIKLNSNVPREFHDESNRNLRFPLEIKVKKQRKRKNVERTRRTSTWPLGADKPAATRSISRKKDGELYRSIRLPASTRLRIQLPLSAGAIYRETNGRCFFRHANTVRISKDKGCRYKKVCKLTSRNENIFSTKYKKIKRKRHRANRQIKSI